MPTVPVVYSIIICPNKSRVFFEDTSSFEILGPHIKWCYCRPHFRVRVSAMLLPV